MKNIIKFLVIVIITLSSQLALGQSSQYEEYYHIFSNESITSSVPSSDTVLTTYPKHGNLSYIKEGDEAKFKYTPHANYYGLDTFKLFYSIPVPGTEFKIKKAKRVVIKISKFKLNFDEFTVYENDENKFLDVLLNDEGLDSTIKITFLPGIVQSNVTISNDSLGLIFNGSNRPRVEYFKYVACDQSFYCEIGKIKLIVLDTVTAPKSKVFEKFVQKNKTLTFNFPYRNHQIIRDALYGYTSVVGCEVNYRPNLDFVGKDTIQIQLRNGVIHTYHIIVEDYANPNVLVYDDYIYALTNQSVIIDVLKNDFSKDLVVSIDDIPNSGTIVRLANGKYRYTPSANFNGLDVILYKACESNSDICETGRIYVTIGAFAPNYEATLTTGKGTPLKIHYPFPVSGYRVEILDQPDHAQASILDNSTAVLYNPAVDFVGIDSLKIEYCLVASPFTCYSVLVKVNVIDFDNNCSDKCVWPGDNNNDGEVNMNDLVFMSSQIGNSGYYRTNLSNDFWIGQSAENWGQSSSNINLKYSDADGNGLISVSDTALLSRNYKNTHGIRVNRGSNSNWVPFVLKSDKPIYNPGDSIKIAVSIGSSNYSVSNLIGYATSFSFSPAFNDATLRASILEDSWVNADVPTLSLVKKSSAHTLDIGSARVSLNGAMGHGDVLVIKSIIDESLDGFKNDGKDLYAEVYISNSSFLMENDLSVNTEAQIFKIKINPNNLPNSDILSLVAYPNPSRGEFTLTSNNGSFNFSQIEVFDINGKRCFQKHYSGINETITLDLDTFTNGVYFAKCTGEKGTQTIKLQIL